MVEQQCAITTRVSPSFVRIGHFDLFARRVDELLERAGGDDDENEVDDMDETSEGAQISSASSRTMTFGLPLITNDGKLKQKKKKIAKTSTYCELEDMMWHACYREYHDTAYAPYYGKGMKSLR